MSRIPYIAILVAGLILLIYGLNASNSMTSSVSNALSGAPTNKSIWLIVLGAVGVLSGAYGVFLRKSD
jgi:hypothetical protein